MKARYHFELLKEQVLGKASVGVFQVMCFCHVPPVRKTDYASRTTEMPTLGRDALDATSRPRATPSRVRRTRLGPSMLRAYEMYIANRFGHWFRLPWAWALLCHSVYGRDVAKQLVELVNSGRLARSGMLAAKIDYAGVLADDALWAAVVAFAAGTEPLDAAAHTQSLKKLRQEIPRAPRAAISRGRPSQHAHNTQHAPRERAVDAPPPVRAPPRRRVGLRDPRRRRGSGTTSTNAAHAVTRPHRRRRAGRHRHHERLRPHPDPLGHGRGRREDVPRRGPQHIVE